MGKLRPFSRAVTAGVLVVALAAAGVVASAGPAVATPPSPPPAVNPTPAVQAVTTSGPTLVPSGAITKDTVWGPLGSPYIVGF